MCLWVYTTPDIYPEASELYLEINKNQALTNNGSISLEWKFSLNPSTYYDRVIIYIYSYFYGLFIYNLFLLKFKFYLL